MHADRKEGPDPMLLIQMAFSGDFQLSETFTSEISDFIT